jgi:NitT/TauT family transport system substrate-binding protein
MAAVQLIGGKSGMSGVRVEMRYAFLCFVMAAGLLAGCAAPPAPPASERSVSSSETVSPSGSVQPAPSETPAPPTPVELAMGYIPSVQFAPFYVAQQRGYFKDAGLDVKFRYGSESDLLKLVGTNQLSFMIGSGEEVILGRSQGLPVRYVMRWYRRFPVVLFAKAEEGIKSPLDLVGKRVGLPGLYGANYVGWEAMVYATGLDPAKVNLESIGFTQAGAVSADKVDAALDYVVNGPVQLELAGQAVTVLPVYDYVDLPSNGIITNDQTIKEQPQVVQALVTAVKRGLADTLADPDAAFEISLAAVPEAGGEQAKVSRAIFDASLKLWQAEPGQLGRSDPATWERAATFMKKMGLIQTAVNPDDLYTNDFVGS